MSHMAHLPAGERRLTDRRSGPATAPKPWLRTVPGVTHALAVLWRDAPLGAPLTALVALGIARLPPRARRGAIAGVALLLALVLLDHRPGLDGTAPRHQMGAGAPAAVSGPSGSPR
jgi:hypothetical protein